jgi:tRNA nucleotidyltransferase (CCA-adding enzyme)
MRIILTHEQTDFDGLASLLGAHLLDETSIPVLPRRLNRNVRAFLTLYGVGLPFVDPRDLPNRPIESVCLVDTQSMTSIKGMEPDTNVHVIDHHKPRKDLPSNWRITGDETGANTTLLVEAIQERDFPLSVVQATLLLLGIYEDTGSLTYSRTTARDVRATAYLLDQGASLPIATDFLNHPLSLAQQQIYDQLRANAENLVIHGHTIILAVGDAQGMNEELSTIAHKLRDLLDPDAIILVITIRGGVQLIARSTSDNIDVSKIAAHFSGGGHQRAAAALIKHRDRQKIVTELLEILPDHVRPSVTVAQIMSRAPQVLDPGTPVQQAAKRMQRYGYEGYPVVKDGKILGLLTRRAVDRALAHKLNLTAASLMEAGEVWVKPDDSIEQLQNVMTDTGWGQIPVVNPENKAIIGIVTRTDLLKTLAPDTPPPERRNLADRLESVLPAPRLTLLKTIAEIAHQKRAALYIVGGFVRDLLLGYPSLDFDLVVEGDAIELADAVGKRFGGRVTSHARFGTAKWFIEEVSDKDIDSHQNSSNGKLRSLIDPYNISDLPETLDFITARTEFYTHPTALPTVERGSIKLDLHRRDFTINTLAMRLDGRYYGELLDYWGGYNDLKQGLVRVLHSLSFVDDPTRILRAVRYEQRYGFKIGERTRELLILARPMIDRVSGDRIRNELDNILKENRAPEMIERLKELDILKVIHPDLQWDPWVQEHLSALKDPPDPVWNLDAEWKRIPLDRALAYSLWLIRLPSRRAKGVSDRLRLTRVLAETIQYACDLRADLNTLAEARPSAICARLEKIPVLAIYAAYLATNNDDIKQALQNYVVEWKHTSPQTSGYDLRALGLAPGPHYKQILNRLRDAWLDGEVSSNDDENALVEKLIRDWELKGQGKKNT